MGLIDGLYPGAAAAGSARLCRSPSEITPPRIYEVYTRGVLTLARLGREAPIAAVSPEGPVLRHVDRSQVATGLAVPELPAKGAASCRAPRSSAPTRRSSTSRRRPRACAFRCHRRIDCLADPPVAPPTTPVPGPQELRIR